MKNYKQQLDTLFSRAQQASAGTRLLSEGDIRNLLAEGTPAPVTTSTKPKGIRQMIIGTSITGLAALITMSTLFFTNTPQPQQAASPAVVQQQTASSKPSRHYSTPGIAGKEKAQVVKPALAAPARTKQANQTEQVHQREQTAAIDLPGVRMLELTDAELTGLGIEHSNDAIIVYQRRSNGKVHAMTVGSFGTMFDSSVEPAPNFPVLPEDYLRMITDDLGNRRIEQYNDDKEKASDHAAKEAGLTTIFIPNHDNMEQSSVVEIRGSGNNKTQTTRTATAREINDFTESQSSRKKAVTTASDVRTEKWIAIAVKSDKPQSSNGTMWRTNYVLWYEATPEVVAALPERYRSELERELQLATSVADGTAASDISDGFIGMWQTTSGAITAASSYPNPVENGAITLNYTLSSPRSVQVTLRSITGALISRLGTKQQQAGAWTEEYKIGNLQPGMYLISIETNNGEYSTQRFIVK